ncbi:MAG TPA: TetR/AcrR family transcriptional regulator [Candidatus Limiplasma sp.]|nr:TetR/AcrR family transcriptional regulator [Candidatus Limiplasma sp.]HRX08180.1 TetR/AcrR family transcriptional regulator [Candidatus Limiplasma sp.]
METEERIILAALRQFETHGFMAATTKSIAAEAGVAEVTLFRTFGDKKSLFLKVASYLAGNFGLMEIPNVKTGDYRQDMLGLCQTLLRNFIRFNALFRMLIFEAKKYEDIRVVLLEIRGKALQNIQTLAGHYASAPDAVLESCTEWLGNSLIGSSIAFCLFHSAEDEDAYVNTHAEIIADAYIEKIKTTEK